jgi:hypothetical protein
MCEADGLLLPFAKSEGGILGKRGVWNNCLPLLPPKLKITGTLKQNASRVMFIIIKILEMYLELKYCEVNNLSNLHIAIGT